ncbi:conserved hypothetical protein [Trichinella spiralis]|uniref:hypothetical protein n=1 Tax=Trichinella spiralis TaxID=6334 RepID=UPI0001EFD59D|nr:conserved hypothetical protein [Trichinella spiralis]
MATLLITNNQVPILTVVIHGLFVLVTKKLSLVLVNCDNYRVRANIGPHKFIAFSNNDNQIETVLLNDLKTITLKHTVIFTASTTDTATITHVLNVLLHSY